MRVLETFRTGMEAVVSHRLRSALTVLGVMIGITAVILTVGLGEGAQQQVTSQISALGSNLLTVTPGSTTSSSGVRGGFGSASTLTVGDSTALTSKVVAPDIAAVAPAISTNQSLVAGSTNWTTSSPSSTNRVRRLSWRATTSVNARSSTASFTCPLGPSGDATV